MTISTQLLTDGFGRIRDTVHAVLDGADEATLTARLDPQANSIGWLVWHLTRIQDDHLAAVAGREQVWTRNGWYERFGLPFDAAAHGYGHTSDDVAAVRGVPADLMARYLDEVHAATEAYLATLADEDMGRVVDEHWDPPVTLGVRLVSVLSDDLQHAGQAAFIRGVLDHRG